VRRHPSCHCHPRVDVRGQTPSHKASRPKFTMVRMDACE